MTADDALTEITRCAGTQFDPVVVDAFCTVLATTFTNQTPPTTQAMTTSTGAPIGVHPNGRHSLIEKPV